VKKARKTCFFCNEASWLRKLLAISASAPTKQDLEKQRHLLLESAQKQRLIVDEFIEIEVSSRKGAAERRIDELHTKLGEGDILLVAELSRLGRDMLQVLNIINDLSNRGIKITFVRQPELSTTGSHGKLLLAIYSYFAEAEREFISMRVKQGLAAVKAKGVKLGRPKGSRNKERVLDAHRDEILKYLRRGIDLASVRKLINPELDQPLSYNSYKYFVTQDLELLAAWQKS
jgi:DNA invertase Pin-like site-specific DNA recombinase